MNYDSGIDRLLDANFNRAMEAVRVCEDVNRFILNSRSWTAAYKDVRHQLRSIELKFYSRQRKVTSRDIVFDVGKASLGLEMRRKRVKDVFWANSQRAKESLRVLEEFAKMRSSTLAGRLKVLRYRIYELEKKVVEQF